MRCTDENGMLDFLLIAWLHQVQLLHVSRRVLLINKGTDGSNSTG